MSRSCDFGTTHHTCFQAWKFAKIGATGGFNMKARHISVLALALAIAITTAPITAIAAGGDDDGGGGGGGGADGGGDGGDGGGGDGDREAGFAPDGSTASRQAITAYRTAVKAVEAANYATAITLLNGVIAGYPDNANAYNYLGYANRKQNRFEAAHKHYSKALELNPKHLGANEYMGELYLDMGQVGGAEQRLAVLRKICRTSCEEYDELKLEIDKYWKANSLTAIDLVLGESLALGKARPAVAQQAGLRGGFVVKKGGNLAFHLEKVDWAKNLQAPFNVSTHLYKGKQAIVRYDSGIATYVHSNFTSGSYDQVVKFYKARLGSPISTSTREVVRFAQPRLQNPTAVWKSYFAESDSFATLEIRKYDDARGDFPDTRTGVVLLYSSNASPVFPELTSRDLMNLR